MHGSLAHARGCSKTWRLRVPPPPGKKLPVSRPRVAQSAARLSTNVAHTPVRSSLTAAKNSRSNGAMVSALNAGAAFSPLVDELGLLAGQLTPRLQEGLVRLSTHIPSFAKAATEFAFFTQVEVHRTTASRISEAAGATAVALETGEAEHILRTHPLPLPGPEQLVFSVDGAMIGLVGGVWAEA